MTIFLTVTAKGQVTSSRAMEVLEQAELVAIPVSEPPQNPHGEVCETCMSDSVFSALG
jgi:hypothetical protein